MLTAIVGILLGNLLIATLFAPALRRLRDILDKFASIELPYHNLLGEGLTGEQFRQAEAAAGEKFSTLFREYNMSYQAFRKIAAVFVIAIIVLACAVAWQTPLHLAMRFLIMLLSTGTILIVGLFLKTTVAPSPGQLVSIDFLQNNFANLHLESFFNSSRLHVVFGRSLIASDPVMHFALFQKMVFLGYRFLFAVTNRECSRLYFVSYGQLDSSTDFRHYWTPTTKAFEIPLGDFSFSDALRDCNSLCFHLWLFIPTPKGWQKPGHDHPRFLSEEITTILGDQVGVRLSSGDCKWDSIDAKVDFDRKSFFGCSSYVISRIDVPRPESADVILRRYKEKVEHCKDTQSEDLPSGVTIGR